MTKQGSSTAGSGPKTGSGSGGGHAGGNPFAGVGGNWPTKDPGGGKSGGGRGGNAPKK